MDKLDAEELKQAMSESGREVTIEEAADMISKHDTNNSGTIGFHGELPHGGCLFF